MWDIALGIIVACATVAITWTIGYYVLGDIVFRGLLKRRHQRRFEYEAQQCDHCHRDSDGGA